MNDKIDTGITILKLLMFTSTTFPIITLKNQLKKPITNINGGRKYIENRILKSLKLLSSLSL